MAQLDHSLAPLGVLGRYYAARNVLGHYRSDALTAVCSVSGTSLEITDGWFTQALRYALARTVLKHPSLCFGIVGEGLLRLREVKWEDVVEFREQKALEGKLERDEVLGIILGKLHERIWTDGETKPPWKVIVVRYGNLGTTTRVDIVLLAHHAIIDGLSAVVFHQTLLEGFQKHELESHPESAWPVQITPDIRPPAPLEQLLDLKPPSGEQTGAQSLSVWAGAGIQLPSLDKFESCLRIITIPSPMAKDILQLCKKSKITLTGYIHGLIVLFLCQNIPKAEALSSVTPYSVRSFTGAAVDEIANHMSCITSLYLPETLEEMRRVTPGSVEELALIIRIALSFRQEITAELAICPENNIWSPLLQVQDMVEYCRKQIGTKRAHTYELSNLGVAKMPAYSDGHQLKVERLVFSQSAFVAGPAIGCSTVSLGGGPLVLSLIWQKGIVEEGLMDDLRSFLTATLAGVC